MISYDTCSLSYMDMTSRELNENGLRLKNSIKQKLN